MFLPISVDAARKARRSRDSTTDNAMPRSAQTYRFGYRILKPLVDFHDERSGLWTRFEVQPDRIVFRRGTPNTTWAVRLFGIVVIAMLIIGMVQSSFGLCVLALFVLFGVWCRFEQYQSDKLRFPIVISKNVSLDSSEFGRGRIFGCGKVERIIVRENANRDVIEDSHLIQIYMQIKGEKYLVLLYQDYYTDERSDRVNQIADDFRRWLGR